MNSLFLFPESNFKFIKHETEIKKPPTVSRNIAKTCMTNAFYQEKLLNVRAIFLIKIYPSCPPVLPFSVSFFTMMVEIKL